MKTIVLTGGGTAGHVTPHVALLPLLKKGDYDVHYIGTSSGIEYSIIAKENIPFYPIRAGKLRRYMDLKNVTDVFKILHGFFQSLIILIKIKPHIVFSKGGFVSCPVVWAAWLLKIPVVIHESDMSPGLANRLSMPFARNVCYSFPETQRYLQKDKARYTGLPVRSQLFTGDAVKGYAICGFKEQKPVLLIMGGSLGSRVINEAVRNALPQLLPSFNVCHLCGKGNATGSVPGYCEFEYVTDQLPHLFAATALFIGRSGATTLFELLALHIPALYIPLSFGASRGDQILNAESFKKQGYCSVLPQEKLTVETLVAGIKDIYAQRDVYCNAMKQSAVPEGNTAVFSVIDKLVS